MAKLYPNPRERYFLNFDTRFNCVCEQLLPNKQVGEIEDLVREAGRARKWPDFHDHKNWLSQLRTYAATRNKPRRWISEEELDFLAGLMGLPPESFLLDDPGPVHASKCSDDLYFHRHVKLAKAGINLRATPETFFADHLFRTSGKKQLKEETPSLLNIIEKALRSNLMGHMPPQQPVREIKSSQWIRFEVTNVQDIANSTAFVLDRRCHTRIVDGNLVNETGFEIEVVGPFKSIRDKDRVERLVFDLELDAEITSGTFALLLLPESTMTEVIPPIPYLERGMDVSTWRGLFAAWNAVTLKTLKWSIAQADPEKWLVSMVQYQTVPNLSMT